MKGKDLQFGIFAILILGLLAVMFFSFVNKVRAAVLIPTDGIIEEGYLDTSSSLIDGINLDSYFQLYDPNSLNTSCIQGSSLDSPARIGSSAGWDVITDWSVLGTWTLREYSDSDPTCESSVIETNEFVLSSDPAPPDPENATTTIAAINSLHGDTIFFLSLILSLLSFMASASLFGTFLPKVKSK